MTVATGNFAELLWPGILDIWGTDYNKYPTLWTQVFKSIQSDKAFEKLQGVTGLPLAAQKDQGSPVPYLDPMQGYQKEFVNVTYAIGGSVTREMWEDDQYSYINSLPQMLARSMRETEEVTRWAVLNNAFSTELSADGSPILSATHPLVGGGTLSNLPATATDLTMASLENACTDIMNFLDDQSLTIRQMPVTLVVSTAFWHVAEKILGTDRAVGSADNDINVVRGKMKLVVSPFLTDPDAWFIMTDAMNGLVALQRRAAELDRDNDFDTKNLKFTSTARWSQGCVDFRGVYGSPGA